MITVDLGVFRGGLKRFNDLNALGKYAESQRDLWASSSELAQNLVEPSDFPELAALLLEPWQTIHKYSDRLINASFVEEAQREINELVSQRSPIAFSSPAGSSIRSVLLDEGILPAIGATKLAQALPDTASIPFMSSSEQVGARRLERDFGAAYLSDIADKGKNLSQLLDMYEAQTHELEAKMLEITGKNQELIRKIDETAAIYEARFAQFIEDRSTETARSIADWNEKHEAARKSVLERTKIKKPVALWAEIAKKHEFAYRIRAGLSVAVGSGGIFLAFVVVKESYRFAEQLFKDASTGVKGATASVLRATWLHELIFTASATLLYLTIYLWMTRILVRMMLSEHHLAVDARSREAMADTYLGLIAENEAADEKDRAIILNSLFRPVTDGLVKDDALPLISPASLLSSKLAGSG
ncbi:hypothetical protein ABIC65_000954 [Sphingomonas trueperi]|uniref:DUF6161 domain-containing protein n=1 Tax=Sphingomonas trueperi TaxID=53317 RepID=UPI00339B6B58